VISLAERLARLEAMSPAQLRAAWRDEWRKPVPPIGPDLLRRGIAWRIQVRVHGSLSTATSKAIDQALDRLERTGEVGATKRFALKPGTRLVREWRGATHHVLVLDDGFEHQGRRYSSLSQIVRAITGTNWSGPLFFGLRKRPRVSRNG
jgi:hypothetical protein